jgi:hypothetical protein
MRSTFSGGWPLARGPLAVAVTAALPASGFLAVSHEQKLKKKYKKKQDIYGMDYLTHPHLLG